MTSQRFRARISLVAVITLAVITLAVITLHVIALDRSGSERASSDTVASLVESPALSVRDHEHLLSAEGVAHSAGYGAPTRYGAPSASELERLPEARYDAVIEGLLAASHTRGSGLHDWAVALLDPDTFTIHSLATDAALYSAPPPALSATLNSAGAHPIALFPAQNFLGEPSVVVAVTVLDGWALVLTPARQSLPSKRGGSAPAQTAGWIRSELLRDSRAVTRTIVISLSAQQLTIRQSASNRTSVPESVRVPVPVPVPVTVTGAEASPSQTFPAGIGAKDTPTPLAVTGYLQARYLDAAQNQAVHRVQLTSLHSSASDEPYGGSDGGLIGIHYERQATGAVSHGCIRLSAEALAAVDSLPLGTPISIVE